VNLGKLTKRLQKELKANPKQAAVLGIVSLVAVWFWGPLLWKWVNPKSAEVAKAKEGESPPAQPAPTAKTPVASQQPAIGWRELQSMRSADPLTQPAPLANDARDPFQPLIDATALVSDDDPDDNDHPTRAPVEEEVESNKVGLVLESIVHSSSRRRAQISGQTVKEGDPITLGGGGPGKAGQEIVGRVAAISPNEVVIELGGQEVRLKLRTKTLARGNVIQQMKSN